MTDNDAVEFHLPQSRHEPSHRDKRQHMQTINLHRFITESESLIDKSWIALKFREQVSLCGVNFKIKGLPAGQFHKIGRTP